MDPDDYQRAWQEHTSQTRVSVDADLLLKEVQRNQQDFTATIFRRDFVEIGVGILLLPLWFYLGFKFSLPWTWYLGVPAILWSIGFFLVDCLYYRPAPTQPSEPLLNSARESLAQIEHQIWLLRNIFWWYILPFTLAALAFFVQVTWLMSRSWLYLLDLVLFVAAVDIVIFFMNQRAVDRQLEPRRRELLALLASLGDESTEDLDTIGSPTVIQSTGTLKRLFIIACACYVVFRLFQLAYSLGELIEGPNYPRLSPFAAVRWEQSQPEVKVNQQWYKLMALDDLPATNIVAFSRERYGNLWQKRFEEDLVELLSQMGHPPQVTVKLELQSLTTSETQVLEEVPMTASNRMAIRAAAQKREKKESED